MGKGRRKQSESKDIMGLVYTQRDSLLYGCIMFIRPGSGSKPTKPFRQSAPFVISQSIGPNETVVYGSVDNLVREIQRLLKDIDEHVDELSAAFPSTAKLPGTPGTMGVLKTIPTGDQAERTYCEYTRRMTNTLLLLSVQTRNLFQIFPRFNKLRISLFSYDGKLTEDIALKDVFDQFVHNRYLFFDGEHVSDLFSDKPPSRAPISGTFMGYKINWVEYINTIGDVIRDIRLKDLTGLLRGRLKKLALSSEYKDIVFLVQNLESFSMLLSTKLPDSRYRSMVKLLFGEMSTRYLNDNIDLKIYKAVRIYVFFSTPHIKIHDELGKKKFKVSVRLRLVVHDNKGRLICEEPELSIRSIEVGYERFFDHVNDVFGKDLLLDFSFENVPAHA